MITHLDFNFPRWPVSIFSCAYLLSLYHMNCLFNLFPISLLFFFSFTLLMNFEVLLCILDTCTSSDALWLIVFFCYHLPFHFSNLYLNIHSSFIYNAQKLEKIQMSINWWWGKQIIAYSYTGMLPNNKEEESFLFVSFFYCCKRTLVLTTTC